LLIGKLVVNVEARTSFGNHSCACCVVSTVMSAVDGAVSSRAPLAGFSSSSSRIPFIVSCSRRTPAMPGMTPSVFSVLTVYRALTAGRSSRAPSVFTHSVTRASSSDTR
jgi:hypothetical protein